VGRLRRERRLEKVESRALERPSATGGVSNAIGFCIGWKPMLRAIAFQTM